MTQRPKFFSCFLVFCVPFRWGGAGAVAAPRAFVVAVIVWLFAFVALARGLISGAPSDVAPAPSLSPPEQTPSVHQIQSRSRQDESEPSLLAIMSPLENARGYLIRGAPADIFPRMIKIEKPDLPRVEESEWLESQGLGGYHPARRDPVYAPDYGLSEAQTKVAIHREYLDSLAGNAFPLEIKEGQALLRGVQPGVYCLVLVGPEPVAAMIEVAGPVTLLRADAWEPILSMYYVSLLETFDESAFRAALSPAPYAQINPLIRRLRDSSPISPVELYLFYRGYYEALTSARWVETAPDGRLREFLNRLRATDAHIDQLVAEGLRRQQLTQDFLPGLSAGQTGSAPSSSTQPPSISGAEQPAARLFQPGIAHYKSFYYVGAASLFMTETQDLTIPRSEGAFVHPDEARLYAEQCREIARLCARWAADAFRGNPLLATLDGHFRFQSEP